MKLAPCASSTLIFVVLAVTCVSCARVGDGSGQQSAGQAARTTTSNDLTKVGTLGSIEVVAKLLEVPEGAIFKRDLYDYATVLKYQVIEVRRGKVDSKTIFVGHYNPFKPRSESADGRVKNVGGNLRALRAGQVHHMALEVPIDDFFMGGIVNKYFEQSSDPIYWAVWTDTIGD